MNIARQPISRPQPLLSTSRSTFPSLLPHAITRTATAYAQTMFEDTSDTSSELSSPPSSPIPPPDFYPTPTPSQDFDGLDAVPFTDRDDMPPAKKRRKIEPKPRTTQHLDLSATSLQAPFEQSEQFAVLAKALSTRRKIVVIAGAGISVSAGSMWKLPHCRIARFAF